jgi:hypothetical protein
MMRLAPRSVRKLWRRLMRDHRDTLNILLIGALFVIAGIFAARKLIP